MKVIKKFIANNSEGIDMDRIYIGGDSNGGFMTLRMLNGGFITKVSCA